MRTHARPQIEPDRQWYVSAYYRAVKRAVAVAVFAFLCLQDSTQSVRAMAIEQARGRFATIPFWKDQAVWAIARDLLESWVPFSLTAPGVVQLSEYLANVFLGPIGVTLAVAGLLTAIVHIGVRRRRVRR